MSTRQQPVEVIGAISIMAPTAGSKGYYRLNWREPDGTRPSTTAGKTIEGARGKATAIAVRLDRAASPYSVTSMQTLVDAYLDQGVSPFDGETRWGRTTKTQLRRNLNNAITGDEHLQAMDVTREVLDRMRSRGGTTRMVTAMTTGLRGLLLWGHVTPENYFTAEQSELLPVRGAKPRPKSPSKPRPRRRTSGRESGSGKDYISHEDAPSASGVVRLGRGLDRKFPQWGRLAPEFAANTGARWGEQFQLTAYDVHLDGCPRMQRAHFHVDHQIDADAPAGPRQSRLKLPKMEKRRRVPIATTSFTGYPLRDVVRQRVETALAEQDAGTNDEALLFPTTTGLMFFHSSFSDTVRRTMRDTGWPFQEWTDDEGKVHYVHDQVWHSLRHRFARICVDDRGLKPNMLMAIGGWENIETVNQRYYRSGDEATDEAAELFED